MLFLACGEYVPPAGTCKVYVTCYELTGGTKGALDSSYGAMGTCWTTTQQAADDCSRFCASDLQRLEQAHPDAGCKAL